PTPAATIRRPCRGTGQRRSPHVRHHLPCPDAAFDPSSDRRKPMRSCCRPTWLLVVAGLAGGTLLAQEPLPSPPAPAATAVAATVNGQAVPEAAVQRGLKRVPPVRQAEARADILDYLIDNTLIDQYLAQANIAVTKEEVDARYAQILADIKKQGGSIEK